jgi:hypothetical protein
MYREERRQPSLMEPFKRSRVISESDDEEEHDGDCLVSTRQLQVPPLCLYPCKQGQTRPAVAAQRVWCHIGKGYVLCFVSFVRFRALASTLQD